MYALGHLQVGWELIEEGKEKVKEEDEWEKIIYRSASALSPIISREDKDKWWFQQMNEITEPEEGSTWWKNDLPTKPILEKVYPEMERGHAQEQFYLDNDLDEQLLSRDLEQKRKTQKP